MSTKKTAVSAILLLFLSGFLTSQNLVDVAKKEKERRAKWKGKKSVIVTNDTLRKRKIEPALSYKSVKSPYEETLAVSDMPDNRVLETIPSQVPMINRSPQFHDVKALEDRWREAKEIVALYILKMNALQQEYHSMGDMTPRSLIQQKIADTYLKLQKAQKDAEKAKQDLDEARKNNKKKTSGNR